MLAGAGAAARMLPPLRPATGAAISAVAPLLPPAPPLQLRRLLRWLLRWPLLWLLLLPPLLLLLLRPPCRRLASPDDARGPDEAREASGTWPRPPSVAQLGVLCRTVHHLALLASQARSAQRLSRRHWRRPVRIARVAVRIARPPQVIAPPTRGERAARDRLDDVMASSVMASSEVLL